MKRIISLLCFIALLVSMTTLGSLSASAIAYIDEGMPVKDHAYSFVFVGDTQTICESDKNNGTKNMDTLYQWIVDNKDEKKIEFVFGLGDITESPSGVMSEWVVAKDAIYKLNGVVPYSLVRGNHDSSVLFNYFFNSSLGYNKIGYSE